MRIITRTVFGAEVQSNLMLGLQHTWSEYGTMNKRFEVQEEALLKPNDTVSLGYYTIGYGGHRMYLGADMIAVTEAVEHAATDVACFKPLPFVLLPLTEDLTIAERANYCLRSIVDIQGVLHVAYYGKRLDKSGLKATAMISNMEGGIQENKPFIPDNSNLKPKPLKPHGGDQVISASGEYVSASAILTIDFGERDAEHLRNVATILFNHEKYAIVSEIALCSGVDRVVSGQSVGGNTISYNEVIGCQPMAYITTGARSMVEADAGFKIVTDVGITEPLFIDQSITPERIVSP